MVKLRSRSDLHCIRAIIDGTVKPVMNVVGIGKPKLKFRQLVDIYNSENVRGVEEVARIQPRVVSEVEHVSEKTEASSCLSGALVNLKPEPEDFDMTLEKVRRQCKEKKRKLRDRGDTESVSMVEVKQECMTLQSEVERCDLEEPLSMWNTKFSKKRKKKQEQKTKFFSTTSASVEKVGLPLLCDVKPEPCDDSYSVSEAVDSTPADLFLDSKEQGSPTDTEPSSPGMLAIEGPITTTPVDKAFADVSEEFNRARRTQCSLADNITLENKETVLHINMSREEAESVQNSVSEVVSCVPVSSSTSSSCEEAKEGEENNDSDPSLGTNITVLDIVKTEAPEILAIDYPGLPIVWETKDIANDDDLPEATDIMQLTNCCDSLANLHLVPNDSPVSVLEEHQLPDEDQLYKATDEVTTDTETDGIQQQKPHIQPGKLLSGRKALSPNSQAKLIKAIEHPDSPEKKSKKTKGKLYFRSQSSHRILKAQGLDNIDLVEVIPNSKQAIQKANNNTQLPKATRKFSRRVTQTTKQQPFGSGSASLQGCTQKAISFSRGQVRDFRFVAARLTEEIKSLRRITNRCLLADDSNNSNISECDLDKVKAFVKRSEKTEQKSKRWLSLIERDCNRFCTVMGMVTEDSPATENIVHKKKIKFADDEGGDLCHVKVFESIDFEI